MSYEYTIEVISVDGKPAIKVKDKIFTKYTKIGKLGEINHLLDIDINFREPMLEIKYDEFDCSELVFSRQKSEKNSYNHWLYSKMGEHLQLSPSKFRAWFNSLMYKVFVSDLDQYHVKKFALHFRKKGQIDSQYIDKIRSVSNLLDELKADGIYNVAPFVLHFQMSPSELKKKFGKGTWKMLTKNSFGRNKLLIEALHHTDDPDKYRVANEYPTSLIESVKRLHLENKEVYDYIKNTQKGNYGKSKHIVNQYILCRDTIGMAQQLGEKISFSWNSEKMKQKHDEFAKRISRLQYSNTNFGWLKNKGVVFSLKHHEYEATLLTNMQLIAEEGEAMVHCVGGYARLSSDGSYAVYSVNKNGEKYSTIGFRRDKITQRLVFEQHYERFNEEVLCEKAKEIPGLILQKNNELLSQRP